MSDLIDRQAAIDALAEHEKSRGHNYTLFVDIVSECAEIIRDLPPAQPETCEGCKHLGKWENEVEYGYPSPCTSCKRRVEDQYER